MPEGAKTRLMIVVAAVLGALYLMLPTFLEWGGVLEKQSSLVPAQAQAAPVSSKERPVDASLRDPEALKAESGELATTADSSTDGSEGAAEAAPEEAAPPKTPAAESGNPAWATLLTDKRLRLGLDLVGGIHLVLEVQAQEALKLIAENHRRDIAEGLAEEKIPFERVDRPLDRPTELIVRLSNPGDRNKVKEFIRDKISYDLIETKFDDSNGTGAIELSFTDDRIAQLEEDAVERVLEILRTRVDEFGVAEPMIYRERGTRVVVQLPGLKDREAAIRTVKRTAQLEFRIVAEDWYQKEGAKGQAALVRWIDEAIGGIGEAATDSQINAALVDKLPEGTEVAWYKQYDKVNKKVLRQEPLLVSREFALTGDRLENAGVQPDPRNPTRSVVSFRMTPEGSVEMGELTEKNVNKRMAIILEGEVKSAPNIIEKISRNGQITLGSGNNPQEQRDEAIEIARVLRSGALPAPVTVEQNWSVGSLLGDDAIRTGVNALLVGGLLVLLLVGFWYKLAGLFANSALLLSALLLLGMMTLFGFTLSLPGIAGIVLTLGMAVDANVLIYERIREELRLNKSPKSAVQAGFDHAASTIIDANLTTAAAGLVLYQFGTGPIQGFALTLLCGIVTTLFGGLVITRLFFDYYVYGRNPDRLSI